MTIFQPQNHQACNPAGTQRTDQSSSSDRAVSPDIEHERVMEELLELMFEELDCNRKRVIFRAYAKLHALRSPKFVRDMERVRFGKSFSERTR